MAYYGVNITWVDLALALAGIALIGAVITAGVLQFAGAARRDRARALVLPDEVREKIQEQAAGDAETVSKALELMVRDCDSLIGRISRGGEAGGRTGAAVRELNRLKAQMYRVSARVAFLPGEGAGAGDVGAAVTGHLNAAGDIDGPVGIDTYDDPGSEAIEETLPGLLKNADAALRDAQSPSIGPDAPDWFGLAQDLKLYGDFMIYMGRTDEADTILRDAVAALYRGYRSERDAIQSLRKGAGFFDED